jgi:hypothetical protein
MIVHRGHDLHEAIKLQAIVNELPRPVYPTEAVPGGHA